MKLPYIILFCCIIIGCGSSKRMTSISKGSPYTANGYLINIYGKYGSWFFQPCSDSSKFVLDAIDNKIFLVQNIQNDLGYTFFEDLEGIGIQIPIVFYDNYRREKIADTLIYLYCRVVVEVIEVPSHLDTCNYTLEYKKKKFPCIFFQNYLTDVEPLNLEMRRKYLQPFLEKKWALPEWAK